MEGGLEREIHEKCGVGAVILYTDEKCWPEGGAVFLGLEIAQDQKNRGDLTTGLASHYEGNKKPIEHDREGNKKLIEYDRRLGTSYEAFGRPDSEKHTETCLAFKGSSVIVHTRYDTSSRKSDSESAEPSVVHKAVERSTKRIRDALESGGKEKGIETIEAIEQEVRDGRLDDLLAKEDLKKREESIRKLKQVLREAHPMVNEDGKAYRSFAIAFNGTIANSEEIKNRLLLENDEDYCFQTATDTEVIKVLIEREITKYNHPLGVEDFKDVFSNVSRELKGSYTLTYMDGHGNIVFLTDPQKFRPAVYALKKDKAGNPEMFAAASETSALNRIGVGNEDIKDLDPGHMVVATNKGLFGPFIYVPEKEIKRSHCIFELVYFAKAISKVFGIDVHMARRFLGAALARMEQEPLGPSTFASPVPSTPIPIMDGYVYEMRNIGLKKMLGYIRSADRNSADFEENVARIYLEHSIMPFDLLIKYSEVRTFISKDIEKIGDLIGRKHFVSGVLPHIKADKIIEMLYSQNELEHQVILFEDSIVRGNTLKRNLEQISRHAKVNNIHVRVGSPQVKFPCYSGIDMPIKEELIANGQNVPQMLEYLNSHGGGKVKSLTHLTIELMVDAIVNAAKLHNLNYSSFDFCTACFDGDYREEGSRELYKSRYR